MATIKEEWARLQFLMEHGRGDEKCHVVLIEEEARERIKNEAKGIVKPKTRFVMETDDPEMYSRFNAQKDRWLRLGNKSVLVDLMCRLWEKPTDEQICEAAEDLPILPCSVGEDTGSLSDA